MVLACILPLTVVAVLFVNSYREQTRQEMRGKVQELCADFANRIQNTGYLTNSAQAELSAAMDTAAQIYDGRILVINSELQIVKEAVMEITGYTVSAFATLNTDEAKKIEPLEEVIDDMVVMLKDRHIERLKAGNCSTTSGMAFLELLTNLERIADQCSNVALLIMSMEDNCLGGE
jgi:Na+/phosphate symporter